MYVRTYVYLKELKAADGAVLWKAASTSMSSLRSALTPPALLSSIRRSRICSFSTLFGTSGVFLSTVRRKLAIRKGSFLRMDPDLITKAKQAEDFESCKELWCDPFTVPGSKGDCRAAQATWLECAANLPKHADTLARVGLNQPLAVWLKRFAQRRHAII